MSYLAGIAAAIGSGLTFNTGLFLQHYAVKRLPAGSRLFPTVLRSRIWLAGLGCQAILAVPLNILATGLIGPALTPCLIAVGLLVLPLAAAAVEKTTISRREMVGIAVVILSAIAIGFSRLAAEMTPALLSDMPRIVRGVMFILPVVLLAIILKRIAAQARGLRAGHLLTITAGLWLGVTAPSVGFLTAALRKLPQGIDASVLVVGGLALLLAIISSLLGIGTTQQAFRYGPAHQLIPIQYLPIQIVPVLSFLLVFRPFTPPLTSVLLAATGIAGIAIGAGLLSARQTR